MYFQNIESNKEVSNKYNNSLKAQAARRLGEQQRREHPSAKMASVRWNVENKWANGANARHAGPTKAEARLTARRNVSSTWPYKTRADHEQHKPGSL